MSPIHHDAVINKSKDVKLEDDHDRRSREVEFTLVKTFSDMGHFNNALKEFAIVKILSSNI